ncbi:MAG: FixH family protein [Marinosulfonomonas sp.]|nr:FixH family protein [Marinosulfonomonas sp.]
MTAKVLTGRKVFFIFAAAFGVVIGVNIMLAVQAISTFPGLVTKNSYVASQSFDRDRAAQIALAWTARAEVKDGILRLSIVDGAGLPVQPDSLKATLGRATHVGEDQIPAFEFDGEAHVAPVDLAPGNWNLRLLATGPDGTMFRQLLAIYVGRTT